MARRFVTMMVFAAIASPAFAAEPIGDWLVEGGYAHVRIANCGDKLWGIVAWEQSTNSKDKNNPDPTLRSRPTLGIPILLGMSQEKPNRWDGDIYNTEDGRTYTAHLSLTNPDTLRVEGCVLGFLCGGQSWTRIATTLSTTARPNVQPGNKPAPSAQQPSRTTGQAPRPGQPAPTPQAAPPQAAGPQPAYGTVDNVCAAVAAATGLPLDPQPTGSSGDHRSAR